VGLEDLQHNFLTGRIEDLVKWARTQQRVAGHLRSGLLRHRDDVGRRRRLRHQPLRHGGLPGLAAPGRPHDRGRSGVAEDGPGAAPGLRPDDGAQVGHLHGRVRLSTGGMFNNYAIVQGVDQIVPGRRLRARVPADPETLMHAILTLHEKIRTGEITTRTGTHRARTRFGGKGGHTEVISLSPMAPPGVVIGAALPRISTSCFPTRDQYFALVRSFKNDAGFEMCIDLCAVDYLLHPERPLPEGIVPTALRGGHQSAQSLQASTRAHPRPA
jgi:NADH-quinone oxidoreductase subunit B